MSKIYNLHVLEKFGPGKFVSVICLDHWHKNCTGYESITFNYT